ncbi:MAG: DNA polymerase III subunit gamma/tau [Bacillota bacterium]|nr:DNA polymerase III subunit gamma/tau [Bacillota bacterium]
MSYLALYRKYRPNNFNDIVGQSEIIEILKNQIITGKFGHAYLFSGIRGTGKTSTAKTLAKTVNCLNPQEGNPCNECEICKEINNESFMDVIEIDAASNNGVDNIRELREHSKYLPSKGKYKVYIIDEVQMLSTGAFNALLKTLEEPSEHVMFILATTEPEKIPVTILSRCQRYDFKRVRLIDMIDRMKFILNDIDVACDEEVLEQIAIKSDGAMRDALSLLEKVVSKSDGHISLESATKTLGIVEFNDLMKIMTSIVNNHIDEALIVLNNMLSCGISVSSIFNQLLEFLRNITLANVFGETNEIIELSVERQEVIINEFKGIKLTTLQQTIDILNQGIGKLKYAANPRLNLELSLIAINLLFNKESISHTVEKSISKPVAVAPKENIKIIESEDESISRGISENKGDIFDQWDQILAKVNQSKKIVHAFLIEGILKKVEDMEITIEYQKGYEFHMENVMQKDNKNTIEKIILEHTGKRYSVDAVMKEEKIVEKDNAEKIKEFIGKEFEEILEIK